MHCFLQTHSISVFLIFSVSFNSGCRTKYQVFCLSCEGLICKPACTCCGEINPALKKNPKTCCVMNETNCILISPDSCGGGQFQFCCIDIRCAFPPGGIESEVPCVLAILGCTCCFGYKCKPGCCSTLGSLKTSIQDAGAPAEAIEDASDFDAEACASPVRAVAIDDDARQ